MITRAEVTAQALLSASCPQQLGDRMLRPWELEAPRGVNAEGERRRGPRAACTASALPRAAVPLVYGLKIYKLTQSRTSPIGGKSV